MDYLLLWGMVGINLLSRDFARHVFRGLDFGKFDWLWAYLYAFHVTCVSQIYLCAWIHPIMHSFEFCIPEPATERLGGSA